MNVDIMPDMSLKEDNNDFGIGTTLTTEDGKAKAFDF